MELSLITPIHHLDSTLLLPGRFCLANIAAESNEYMAYFVRAQEDGYKVILDNGVFEGAKLSDREYLAVAKEVKPSVLIVPDTIGLAARANWDDALAFAGICPPLDGVELMFVPQCARDDYQGFERAIWQAIEAPQFKWIGICRDVLFNAYGQFTHTEDQEVNRLYFTAHAVKETMVRAARRSDTKWHYLGMGSNVQLIQFYWFVDSMDTASLFHYSAQGATIRHGRFNPEYSWKRPKDYFRSKSRVEKALLEHNCKWALHYASVAEQLRNRIIGNRI